MFQYCETCPRRFSHSAFLMRLAWLCSLEGGEGIQKKWLRIVVNCLIMVIR